MALSLYTYKGMPLNKILATNENDNANGITKVDNPLENYFKEFNNPTTYNLLTTTATMVQQNLTNVIYTVPGLSSLAGQKYSAYYDVYNYVEPIPTPTTPTPTTYSIDLTNAKACFSYITVILIGGSGAGSRNNDSNGSSGACVIYQINLDLMGDNNIEIVVGNNSTTTASTPTGAGRAGDTILYIKYGDGSGRDIMASASGGQTAMSSTTNGGRYNSTVNTSSSFAAYRYSEKGPSENVDDPNNSVYTINGYKGLLGSNLTRWPIFHENPNFYGGTQGKYALNTTPIPYAGYARVYYML